MACVLVFPVAERPKNRPAAAAVAGESAEILIFPGIRVEYHAGGETLDLSRRIRRAGSDSEQKAVF